MIVCKFKNFIKDEDGAITVDWVMLTAGVVMLGLAVVTTVSTGSEQATKNIADHMASVEPG